MGELDAIGIHIWIALSVFLSFSSLPHRWIINGARVARFVRLARVDVPARRTDFDTALDELTLVPAFSCRAETENRPFSGVIYARRVRNSQRPTDLLSHEGFDCVTDFARCDVRRRQRKTFLRRSCVDRRVNFWFK